MREIANSGFGRADLLRFWFGESDQPTPDYIRRAAMAGLDADEVFYTHNSGRADLCQSLGHYLGRLHDRHFDVERLSITSSGVSALNVAMQVLLDPGDRVVVVTPVWPNVVQIPAALGADVVRVAITHGRGGWTLDLDRLLDAVTPATRLLILNSPGNPTGWTLTAAQQQAILDHCRRLGVWILADDVYERLMLGDGAASAPSFFAAADSQDRLFSANSFSKAWLMTGWRLGWLVAPAGLEEQIGKVIEFNTSCAPGFIQSAGIAALEQGEPHISCPQTDPDAQPRSVDRRTASHLGSRGTISPRRDVCVLSDRGFSRFLRLGKTPCRRSRAWPGAGRGVRARRRGMVALVLCIRA